MTTDKITQQVEAFCESHYGTELTSEQFADMLRSFAAAIVPSVRAEMAIDICRKLSVINNSLFEPQSLFEDLWQQVKAERGE